MTLLFRIFFILFVLSFLLNMIWVFAILNYFKKMKASFPSIYLELGEPPTSIRDLIGNGSIITASPTIGTMMSLATAKAITRGVFFILKKRYEPLNNPDFIKHSRILRAYFFLALFVMLGLFSMGGVIIYNQ